MSALRLLLPAALACLFLLSASPSISGEGAYLVGEIVVGHTPEVGAVILDLPTRWVCSVGGAPAHVGDPLLSGSTVSCSPPAPMDAEEECNILGVQGSSVAAETSSWTVAVRGECQGSMSASVSFTSPGGTEASPPTIGSDSYPFGCTATWPPIAQMAWEARCAVVTRATVPTIVPEGPCDPAGNEVHSFVGPGRPFLATGIQGKPSAFDTCALAVNGYPLPGDSDLDFGISGAALPAYNYCLLASSPDLPPPPILRSPVIAHHSSPVVAKEWFGFDIAVMIGTDGPALAHVNKAGPGASYYAGDWTDCLGNGVITDDGSTDPADCGRGGVGIGRGVADAYSEPNSPEADCQRPADGLIWVTIVEGAVGSVEDPIIVSTPFYGTIS